MFYWGQKYPGSLNAVLIYLTFVLVASTGQILP